MQILRIAYAKIFISRVLSRCVYIHTYIYIPFTLPDVKSNELLRIIFSAVLHTFRDTIERVSSEILNRRKEKWKTLCEEGGESDN